MRKKTYYEAYLDDMNKVNIYFHKKSYGGNSSFFYIEDEEHNQIRLKIMNNYYEGDYHKYECSFDDEIVFGKRYDVFHEYARSTPLVFSGIVKTKQFDEMFAYDGNDLGATYLEEETTFKLWAPTAYKVRVEIEKDNKYHLYEMNRNDKGVYEISIKEDLYLASYVYYVEVNGKVNKTIDPYGKGCTINSKRSVVVDPSKVDIKKYPLKEMKSYTDAIIYEVSIRDYSQRGNIQAFIQKGKNSILSYIKELGVSHIQFLPLMDFKTVDDLAIRKFYNWGYDAYQWMCFEKSYCTDIYDPQSSLYDMADLVNACHEHGLRVNLDVVFNHVYDVEESSLHLTCPYYYFQYDAIRGFSEATGCGNDIDSTRFMCHKIIVDSCKYLTETFSIDGLRFDLMGILDTDTMNEVVKVCKSINKDFMVYGEGWNMHSFLDEDLRATQNNSYKMEEVAHFSDRFRDVIKGGSNRDNVADKGYLLGDTTKIYKAMNVFGASTQNVGDHQQYLNASQCINFVECHDNMTCFDKIDTCLYTNNTVKRNYHILCLSATILAQGIPFIHGGQELARSKNGLHNTYNVSDSINKIDWRLADKNQIIINRVKDLCEIRNTYSCLRIADGKKIQSNVYYETIDNAVLVYHPKDEENELMLYFNPTYNKYKVEFNEGFELIYYNGKYTGESVSNFEMEAQSVMILKKMTV